MIQRYFKQLIRRGTHKTCYEAERNVADFWCGICGGENPTCPNCHPELPIDGYIPLYRTATHDAPSAQTGPLVAGEDAGHE